MNRPIRFGLVGVGGIGVHHASNVASGRIEGLTLSALCDRAPERLAGFDGVASFSDAHELFHSGTIDAVMIATPHRTHFALARAALESGLHVLLEKPITAQTSEADQLLQVRRRPDQVFAAALNQRTRPCHRRIKRLLEDAAIGKIQRVGWVATDWFRTDAYYRSAPWRGTWAGEGGGLLLNQALHQLDLLTWFFGPVRLVHARCHFGRHHPIEVEDEAFAYLEFENGALGTFLTSTGEAPGENRLEIVGDLGRLVCTPERVQVSRNATPASVVARTSNDGFAQPHRTETEERFPAGFAEYPAILQDFADAIRLGQSPIAPAEEGLRGVELANAMLLSQWLGREVTLPLDRVTYDLQLAERIRESRPAVVAR